jgi:hypothetical protein
MVFDSAEVSEALEYRQLLVCEQLITKGWLPELWETRTLRFFQTEESRSQNPAMDSRNAGEDAE